MLIDLHTHTHPSSWDSFLTADELIERCKAADLDGVVLSEHDWAWNPDEVAELAKRHDYLVMAGMEINTEDGHILVYGMHEYVFGMHRAHELAEHVARHDGVMVAAHPYRRQAPWVWDDEQQWTDALERAQRNGAYRYIAAMEILNGRGNLNENLFSQRLAEGMGMPSTAGTDSHALGDIGKAATYFERDIRNERELIEEIRAGRCWAVDLTNGSLTENAAHHSVPDDLDARWSSRDATRESFEAARAG